jgi:poly(beta-D-mannuronate) lyase
MRDITFDLIDPAALIRLKRWSREPVIRLTADTSRKPPRHQRHARRFWLLAGLAAGALIGSWQPTLANEAPVLRAPFATGRPDQVPARRFAACKPAPTPIVSLETQSQYDTSDPTRSRVDEAAEEAYEAAVAPLRSYQKQIVDWANDYIERPQKGLSGAACAHAWLLQWAKADALRVLPTNQAQFNRDNALASLAIAYLQISKLTLPDANARPAILRWLNRMARDSRHYYDTTTLPRSRANNHRYWAALGVAAAAAATNDRDLFQWSLDSFRTGVCSATPEGALPLEMARGKKALDYQLFAIVPLVALAEFGTVNGSDLYDVCDGAIHRIVTFGLQATADPSRVAELAGEEQEAFPDGEIPAARLVFLEPYLKRFPERHPEWAARLDKRRPLKLTALGGDVTLVWSSLKRDTPDRPKKP